MAQLAWGPRLVVETGPAPRTPRKARRTLAASSGGRAACRRPGRCPPIWLLHADAPPCPPAPCAVRASTQRRGSRRVRRESLVFASSAPSPGCGVAHHAAAMARHPRLPRVRDGRQRRRSARSRGFRGGGRACASQSVRPGEAGAGARDDVPARGVLRRCRGVRVRGRGLTPPDGCGRMARSGWRCSAGGCVPAGGLAPGDRGRAGARAELGPAVARGACARPVRRLRCGDRRVRVAAGRSPAVSCHARRPRGCPDDPELGVASPPGATCCSFRRPVRAPENGVCEDGLIRHSGGHEPRPGRAVACCRGAGARRARRPGGPQVRAGRGRPTLRRRASRVTGTRRRRPPFARPRRATTQRPPWSPAGSGAPRSTLCSSLPCVPAQTTSPPPALRGPDWPGAPSGGVVEDQGRG